MKQLRTDPELSDALAQAGVRTAEDLLNLAQPASAHSVGDRIELAVAGTCGRFYLKAYRYPGWRKSKGLIGRGSLWGPAPCVREFRNLAWLRAHGLPAPRPVAAAALTRFGRLSAHALLSEWIDDAPNLSSYLQGGCDNPRQVLINVASVVERMHAEAFAHGDLFLRNILVRLPDVWLLDCRRGRPNARARAIRADYEGLRGELRGVVRSEELAEFDASYDPRIAGSWLGP